MIGGHFDYLQYRISEITDRIDQEIRNNEVKTEYFEARNFSRETIGEFKLAIEYINWYNKNLDNE